MLRMLIDLWCDKEEIKVETNTKRFRKSHKFPWKWRGCKNFIFRPLKTFSKYKRALISNKFKHFIMRKLSLSFLLKSIPLTDYQTYPSLYVLKLVNVKWISHIRKFFRNDFELFSSFIIFVYCCWRLMRSLR